jgi:hypothetical protein
MLAAPIIAPVIAVVNTSRRRIAASRDRARPPRIENTPRQGHKPIIGTPRAPSCHPRSRVGLTHHISISFSLTDSIGAL